MRKSFFGFTLVVVFSFLQVQVLKAQGSGAINRIATSSTGRQVLDPNGDGYTSSSPTGFGNNDVSNSEISFKSIPTFFTEPFGDLRRGPNHMYSDFVPDANGNGCYAYYDGANLIFRMRMGSIMSGSKGYSVLLDTDGKFGATGANPDPNYRSATTGTNGNPGFEIEIVWETNFRIAIYNVDGTGNTTAPVLTYNSPETMSQISIAGTYDKGDPDFFMDFYVPFSALSGAPFSLTTATKIRFAATTVMSPQGAIGGPKSDIYGMADGGTTQKQYEDYINGQPGVTMTDLGSGGSGFGAVCTAAPLLTAPISTGTVSITGSWTKSNITGAANTAIITVFRNGSSVGTVSNVASGSNWTLNNVSIANGDVITATAQGNSESVCLTSNAVTASSCNANTRPAQPTSFCGDRKGFSASSYPAGATITLTRITATGNTTVASGVLGTSGFTSDGAGGWTLSGGCSTGGGSYEGGSYAVTYTLSGCESRPAYACANNVQAGWSTQTTTAPVITQTAIYNSTTTISGTAEAGAVVKVYVNDILAGTATSSGTSWTYSFTTALRLGQVVTVMAQQADNIAGKVYYCAGSATRTVSCFTEAPLVTADNANQITANAFITGRSSEASGTTIRVYNAAGDVLVATTTVQANGTWSTGNAATTPATYQAVDGLLYYVTAQNGSCGVSTAFGNVTAAAATSNARCGAITGPVSPGDASVSGTLTGSVSGTTVTLYIDGQAIGNVITNNASWTIGSIPSTSIYANGVLTIGIQETGKQEVVCAASETVQCSPTPTTPTYTASSSTIAVGQTITYTITNAVSGYYYGVADVVTGRSYSDGAWATTNGNLAITTYPFTSQGTYNVVIKGVSVNATTVCTSIPANAAFNVSSTLPVRFISVSAQEQTGGVQLKWTVAEERNVFQYVVEYSAACNNFQPVGTVTALNAGGAIQNYAFLDPRFVNEGCYRIKAVDQDGKLSFSSIVRLEGEALGGMRIAPNPATHFFNLTVSAKGREEVKLQVLDANGRVVKERIVVLNPGTNLLTIEGLQGLARGQYLIQLNRKGGVEIQKILLQ